MEGSAGALKEEGDQLFKNGAIEEACERYGRALSLINSTAEGGGTASRDLPQQPTLSAVLCNRSMALVKLGRCEEALVDAVRAVFVDGKSLKPRYRHASALKALGRHRAAMEACDAGLAISPDHAQLIEMRNACSAALAVDAAASEAPIDLSSSEAASMQTEDGTTTITRTSTSAGTGTGGGTGTFDGRAASLASAEDEAAKLEDDGDYAAFCQSTANRLYGEGEYGQAVAWYTHAIGALQRVIRREQQQQPQQQQMRKLATVLSNRAASFIQLRRWADVACDCEEAIRLDITQVKAYARGSAALTHLGMSRRAVELAELGLASAKPPEEARAERLEELRGLSVKDLRAQIRTLSRQAARRAAEKAEFEMSASQRRAANKSKNLAPVLRPRETPASRAAAEAAEATAATAEKPIEKEELIREVEALERAAEADGEGGAYNLAAQALAEARAMRDRVGEIEAMAAKADWAATLEHASWIGAEYPQHCALRALRLDALVALGRPGEARMLLEEQLLVDPSAAELLYMDALLVYMRDGADAAMKVLGEINFGETLDDDDDDDDDDDGGGSNAAGGVGRGVKIRGEHARAADLHGVISRLQEVQEEARQALLKADVERATSLACEAACLSEGSHAARMSACLLLARCLARSARHVEVVKACDEGLRAATALAKEAASSGAPNKNEKERRGDSAAAISGARGVYKEAVYGDSKGSGGSGGGLAGSTTLRVDGRETGFKGGAPSEHERLLLRRAASFAEIGQFAEAVADYRSAARLNPYGSQLAQEGLRAAWRALQMAQRRASLYEVLEVSPDSTAEELRKAYRKAALKWHPDRHASADAAKQVEADAKFKELAAAWAILGDEELRAAYDEDLQRGGSGEGN